MSKRASRPNGLHGWCKDCMNSRRRDRKATPDQRRRWSYKARYGLTEVDIEYLLARQQGVCAICRCTMARMVVDHDHSTGVVRGLLCHPCNIKLHALDKWTHRDAAVAYLVVPR